MQDIQKLVGKNVRLYRGGPEARNGTLLDLEKDFLTLLTQDDGVVYYNLIHIKSIIRNSKDGYEVEEDHLHADDDTDNCIKANSFHELLEKMINTYIRIDRGGPEFRSGILLDVFSDYLLLDTEEDGLIYYKTHHIKSVSQETVDSLDDYERESNYETGENFNELLKNLKYNWVKINRGGPEKIEGILVDSSEDFLILTDNDQVNRIPTFHIRNINCVVNKEHLSNESQDEEKDKKQKHDDDDKHDKDKKKDQNKDHKENDEEKNKDRDACNEDCCESQHNDCDDHDEDNREDCEEHRYEDCEEDCENENGTFDSSTSNRNFYYSRVIK